MLCFVGVRSAVCRCSAVVKEGDCLTAMGDLWLALQALPLQAHPDLPCCLRESVTSEPSKYRYVDAAVMPCYWFSLHASVDADGSCAFQMRIRHTAPLV